MSDTERAEAMADLLTARGRLLVNLQALQTLAVNLTATTDVWTVPGVMEGAIKAARDLLDSSVQHLQVISCSGSYLAGPERPGELLDCPDCEGRGALTEALRHRGALCATCDGKGHL